MAITSVAVVAGLCLLMPGAHAEGLLPPIFHHTPSPTPSPSSTPSTTPKPAPKPSSKPSSSPSPQPKGPSPTPYTGLRGAIGYVLDIAGTARNTQHLLDLLTRLKPAGATPSPVDLIRGFGRFPVVGYVWYHDDYGAPRYDPYFHLHEGNDLFATTGTPVIAVVDGVIAKLANGSIGGVSIWLAGDDGITYYYGHLLGYAPGLVAGKRVGLGEIVGNVGDSGVAQGTSPHLHFEVHPGGGLPVSPKAILDSWLVQAETSAVNSYQRMVEYNALNRIGGARWQAIFDLLREPAAPLTPLWTVALDPTGTDLGINAAFDAIAWGSEPNGGWTAPSHAPTLAFGTDLGSFGPSRVLGPTVAVGAG